MLKNNYGAELLGHDVRHVNMTSLGKQTKMTSHCLKIKSYKFISMTSKNYIERLT